MTKSHILCYLWKGKI